ncbi:MAG: TetR family transcriptional regulator [Labilithrix sp.]|nr:TetR family transcriptional regulator [Labilithrix sp.]
MRTKDRIVEAAVDLFNAEGVAGVTTNHIAAHLGMSPGNLYYHYANKEEIVRDAFERMNAEADAVWQIDPPPDPPSKKKPAVDPLALQRIVVGNLTLYARYIFFARELTSLLRADPELRERYGTIATRRMEQLVAVLRPLVDAGLLLNVGDDDDLRALAESAWLIGLFCVPYAETADVAGPPAKSAKARAARASAAVERGAVLVLHLFKPYMDPLAYTALVVLVRSQLETSSNKVFSERA